MSIRIPNEHDWRLYMAIKALLDALPDGVGGKVRKAVVDTLEWGEVQIIRGDLLSTERCIYIMCAYLLSCHGDLSQWMAEYERMEADVAEAEERIEEARALASAPIDHV